MAWERRAVIGNCTYLSRNTSASLYWELTADFTWVGPVHRKTYPTALAVLPSCQNERGFTHGTIPSQVEPFGVFRFWMELLFLCLFQVYCRGLECLQAQFCISSWFPKLYGGPARCTSFILLTGWFWVPSGVDAVAATGEESACPAILQSSHKLSCWVP